MCLQFMWCSLTVLCAHGFWVVTVRYSTSVTPNVQILFFRRVTLVLVGNSDATAVNRKIKYSNIWYCCNPSVLWHLLNDKHSNGVVLDSLICCARCFLQSCRVFINQQ